MTAAPSVSTEVPADVRPGDVPIHYGGPVQPQQGFVLHSGEYDRAPSMRVNERYALTMDAEILTAMCIPGRPGRPGPEWRCMGGGLSHL